MARSRRGKKEEHCKAVKMLFMFDREAVQERKEGLREHEQTRTVVVSWFLFFVTATIFFLRGHRHYSKPTKRWHQGDQLSSQLGLAKCACVTLQRVISWHIAIKRTRLFGVPLLSLLSLHTLRSPPPRLVSETMHFPRVTLPKLCNYKTSKDHSSAWLARTMTKRDKYLLPPPLPSVPPPVTPHPNNLTVRATQPCKHNSYVCARRAIKQTYRLHYPCSYC